MRTNIILLLIAFITILYSCKNDDVDLPTNELPIIFPLEVGNAWKYERKYYENGILDTSYFDTLYIAGLYQDYFLYTWNPEQYYNLVKNVDNKLIRYGYIDLMDTIMYYEPDIWAFYGEIDCLDSTDFENYSYISNLESCCISVENNRVFFGEEWDTYVMEKKYTSYAPDMIDRYNKLGFVSFKRYDENNYLISETVMVEVLNGVTPPEILKNVKESAIKQFNKIQIQLPDGSIADYD